MEIGALGSFNVIMPGKHTVADKAESEGSFAGFMSTALSSKTNPSVAVEQGKDGEKLESLNSLAEMMNVSDLLELEEGMKLLDLLNSDAGNLLNKALSHLGINAEELKLFIQKWSAANEGELPSDEELLSSLAVILSGIANQSVDELMGKLDKNDIQVLKALKLSELMSRYADGHGNSDSLKESMKSLGESLKNLLEAKNYNAHTDYLQRRFTQLARELNLVSKKVFTEGTGSLDNSSGIKTDAAGTLGFLPQMTKAEQLILTLNSPEKPVSAEQLMKQFESILSKSQFMNNGGTQKLFIKLFPEHLGSIRIELFQRDQTMMARIITASGTAKEMLESQINGLKQAFAAQNLSVDRIEVTQQQAQEERFFNRDSEQQREPDRDQQEKKDQKGDFNLSFEEAMLNTEA